MSSIRVASRTPGSLTFRSSPATTDGFMIEQFAGGMIYCSATSTGAAVRLFFNTRIGSSDTETFAVANNSNSRISVLVTPNRCTPLPDELFAATWVTPITELANDTATCRVVLKS